MIEPRCLCGWSKSVSDKYANKRVKCPKCGTVVSVPALPVVGTQAQVVGQSGIDRGVLLWTSTFAVIVIAGVYAFLATRDDPSDAIDSHGTPTANTDAVTTSAQSTNPHPPVAASPAEEASPADESDERSEALIGFSSETPPTMDEPRFEQDNSKPYHVTHVEAGLQKDGVGLNLMVRIDPTMPAASSDLWIWVVYLKEESNISMDGYEDIPSLSGEFTYLIDADGSIFKSAGVGTADNNVGFSTRLTPGQVEDAYEFVLSPEQEIPEESFQSRGRLLVAVAGADDVLQSNAAVIDFDFDSGESADVPAHRGRQATGSPLSSPEMASVSGPEEEELSTVLVDAEWTYDIGIGDLLSDPARMQKLQLLQQRLQAEEVFTSEDERLVQFLLAARDHEIAKSRMVFTLKDGIPLERFESSETRPERIAEGQQSAPAQIMSVNGTSRTVDVWHRWGWLELGGDDEQVFYLRLAR